MQKLSRALRVRNGLNLARAFVYFSENSHLIGGEVGNISGPGSYTWYGFGHSCRANVDKIGSGKYALTDNVRK